ncbi:hypothetical protein M1494_01830 [Candidatus Parvarchaeota archaeon]|nr:hypothetical protein [Candidatus Parvarchaeota archaeon]
MRKSELERILGKEVKKKGYGKYYATIAGAFSAGNAMAYLAYGVHGLFDAMGIDFITLGFTVYEQLKMKQENEKIDMYIEELQDLNDEEKVGLLSFGGNSTSESKAKKIGYITYQLLKDDMGESEEIEKEKGISSKIISSLEGKGYIKKGMMGTVLTKKGKLAYYSIFNNIKEESRGVFYVLRKLYRVSEKELEPIYQLYMQTTVKEGGN